MTGTKYIRMDVHRESISIAVRSAAGKLVMERVIETKANAILEIGTFVTGGGTTTYCKRCPATQRT
jgi:hypothetical protein